MSGPLQVVAVGFGSSVDARGRLLAEVDRLQGRGVVRLLDLLFVSKSEDGTIQRLIIGDDEDFGALLGSIVPFGGAGLVEPAGGSGVPGFDPADARALAEAMLPGTALAFLLIEHGWAQPLFDAIAETGGALIGEGFLTPEVGLLVGAEVAAMDEAARVIAAAQAAEADATLLAMAAEAQAADPEEQAIAALLDALEIDIGVGEGAARTPGHLLAICDERVPNGSEWECPNLREAINRKLSATGLGRYLGGIVDRRIERENGVVALKSRSLRSRQTGYYVEVVA